MPVVDASVVVDWVAADEAFEVVLDLPVALVDTRADLARAWDLARRHDEHPVYDLLYVALAERLGEVPVTADLALAGKTTDLGFVRALVDT